MNLRELQKCNFVLKNNYRNIPKIIPMILKQNLANLLTNCRNLLFVGGRNTNADNISDIDIFFIVGDL